jgi:hypothetical protein
MSKVLNVFLLIWTVFSISHAFSQTKDLLSGRWEYENIRKLNSSDVITSSKLQSVIGENSFYEFQSDNRYSCFVNNVFSRGKWKLTESNQLVLNSDGKIQSFEIVTLNNHSLVLYAKGEAFHTLIRQKQIIPVSDHSSAKGEAAFIPDHMARKWVLIELHDSLENHSINERMTSFVRGGWYDFRSQGNYVKKMIGKEKTGKWKLTEGNRTLIMIDDDGLGAVWHIGFVSASKLVLNKPNSTMKHIFMAIQ